MHSFWVAMRFQIKRDLTSNLTRFILFVQPVLYGTLMYLMFRESGKENFIEYIVLGTGMMNLWSSIIFSSGQAIARERRMGTLELMNVMPTSFQTIISGKIVGAVVISLISTINGYLFIIIISGQRFGVEHPFLFAVALLLVVISCVAIAIMLAAVFAISRQARMLANTAEFPIFIVTGLLFPLTLLPKWVLPISYILTPTWAIKVLRQCIETQNMTVLMHEFTILGSLTVIYFVISFFVYRRMTQMFRETGSLGVI